jgi:hypothetical protein
VIAVALAASLTATDAWSQSAKDIARARERFKEGAALQAAGDFARALEAYKDVALVKSSAQVRFNIASCEEKLGDYVTAMGTYRFALTEATRSNAKNIEEAVTKALADLEPRVPMLLVKRGDGAAVAEVTLDGRALANPSIGVEFQVNPGPHTVKATAPDREPQTVELTLADRDHKVVELVLKPHAAPVVALVGPIVDEPPPPPPPSNKKPLLYGGIAAGGVGVVSVVVAGVFFGMRQSAISTLNADCGPSMMSCTKPSDLSTYNSGKTDASVSTGMLVVGLVALAAGGTLIGLSMRKPQEPKPEAGLFITPSGALGGTF